MKYSETENFRSFLFFSLFFIYLMGSSLLLRAQLNQGGIPLSFKYAIPSREKSVVMVPAPDLAVMQSEDALKPLPYRYAINLPVDMDIRTHGYWTKATDGSEIWRLEIQCPGAKALTLYFGDFIMPEGGKLFVYNAQRTRCLGAFTSLNNNRDHSFASSLLPGDQLTIEYNSPSSVTQMPGIHISEIAYAYRGLLDPSKSGQDFGESGACEVNINCTEGQQWQKQRRGVARISVKQGLASFWCSGSLINNVKNDHKPYFLTADHCGTGCSAADINRWIFYFDYVSPTCENPHLEPGSRTMTGARLIAHGGNAGESGSDFFLVLLKDNVPDTFNVYYNGWSRSLVPSPSGAGIHHPEGDIQKISTYTTALVPSSWNGHPYDSHWKVVWAQTSNGHGVTEGGSSGSPIFDNTGHVLGTLTGGDSRCGSSTEGLPDYYGKFSYSWDQNGSDSSSVLKYWLDPDNTGTMVLDGQTASANDEQPEVPVKIFPNPFTDVLTLYLNNSPDIITISIYDQLGKCVFISEPGFLNKESLTFNLQVLSQGFYFLKLQGRHTNAVLKIIKQ